MNISRSLFAVSLMMSANASAVIVGEPFASGGVCMLRELLPENGTQSEIAAGRWLMVGYVEHPEIVKLATENKADITYQKNVQCNYGMSAEMRLSVWWRCKKGFEAECMARIIKANRTNKGIR